MSKPLLRSLYRPRITPSQIADRGRRAIRRLNEWGIRVGPDVRLVRAADSIERAATDRSTDRDEDARHISRLGESARTALDFYIATHSGSERPGDDICAKFETAIEGADLPDDESSHLARNTQFELQVWAQMRIGGAACRFAEPPDLMVEYADGEVGIAAKRIWSKEQAHKRLSEAAAQIEASGTAGFIAVNAQEYLHDLAEIDSLEAKSPEYFGKVGRLHGQVEYLKGKPHVRGLIVTGTTYSWVRRPGERPLLAIESYLDIQAITDESHSITMVNGFYDAQLARFNEWLRANM